MYIAIFPHAKGPQYRWSFWLKTPTAQLLAKVSHAEACLQLTIEKRETDRLATNTRTYTREHPTHRLSAVAASHGAYVRVPADLTING